jgi:hypothetical protein
MLKEERAISLPFITSKLRAIHNQLVEISIMKNNLWWELMLTFSVDQDGAR